MMPRHIFRRITPAALWVALLVSLVAWGSAVGAQEMPAHFTQMLDGLRAKAQRLEGQGRLVEARQRLELVMSLLPQDKTARDRIDRFSSRPDFNVYFCPTL